MENFPVNITDISVALVLLLSALLAFFRGFIREVLSIGSWVGAIFVGLYSFEPIRPFAHQYIPMDLAADAAAAIIPFILALVVLSLLGNTIAGTVQASNLNAVDRSLGFLFGLARGAVLVCLAYLGIQLAVEREQYPPWLENAKSLPFIEQGSDMLVALVPENLRSDASKAATKAKEDAETELKQKTLETLLNPPTKKSDAPTDSEGYTDKQRQEMNRVIQSSQ